MASQSRGRVAVIAALIGGVLIYGLAMGVTYPLLGIELSVSVPAFWNGLNASATGLGFLLGVLVVPSLGRRLGAGSTALAGMLLMAAALAALAVVRDFWAIFALRLLLGCGGNMLFIVAETALNIFAPPGGRGRVMGVYTAAGAFGFVVGPTVVALAPGDAGLLLLGCAAVALLAVPTLGLARAPVDSRVQPTSVARILPAVAAFPFAFGFLFLASGIDAVVIGLLPVIALDQAYSVESAALFVAIFHIGMLLGQPAIGAALDFWSRRRTVLACCFVSLGCALALALGQRLDFPLVALLMFVWGGTNYGLYTAGLALIGDRFVGAALTAATAAFAAVYAVASIVSPILAGQSIELFGAAGVYLTIAGLYLIAFIFGAAFFRPLEPMRVQVAETPS